jgi:hypothetical protein
MQNKAVVLFSIMILSVQCSIKAAAEDNSVLIKVYPAELGYFSCCYPLSNLTRGDFIGIIDGRLYGRGIDPVAQINDDGSVVKGPNFVENEKNEIILRKYIEQRLNHKGFDFLLQSHLDARLQIAKETPVLSLDKMCALIKEKQTNRLEQMLRDTLLQGGDPAQVYKDIMGGCPAYEMSEKRIMQRGNRIWKTDDRSRAMETFGWRNIALMKTFPEQLAVPAQVQQSNSSDGCLLQ